MKFKALVKEICRREKLKKQVDIAQVTEICGHLADILYETDVRDDKGDSFIGTLQELKRVYELRFKKRAKKTK